MRRLRCHSVVLFSKLPMNIRTIFAFWVLFLFSSCSLFPEKESQVLQLESQSIVVPSDPFADSLVLDREYISQLGLWWQTPLNEESVYMKKRDEIFSRFQSGERSHQILRSYMYLSSLEWNYDTMKDGESLLCEKQEACSDYFTDVLVTGKVVDQNGRLVRNARIDILGSPHTTFTDNRGMYELRFRSFTPAVLRLKASKKPFMIDISRVTLADSIRAVSVLQSFTADFTLSVPVVSAEIDTVSKTITGENTSRYEWWYRIQSPFTRYDIPDNALRSNGEIYQWKISVQVFEFDRENGSVLLDSDVFDFDTHGYITNSFVTYGMPFIIFSTFNDDPIEVLSSFPMKVSTTQREPFRFTDTSTFDSLYQIAYEKSQEDINAYPITYRWLRQNASEMIISPSWVFDQKRGFWDNVGKRFASTDPYALYNVESIFYTHKSE